MLSTVSSHTYLGITVSSDLKWHEHISNICLKATRTLNFVKRNCCSQEAKNLAYLSLVRPHLEYAAAAWDPYTAKDIQQLERVQRRAARFVKKRLSSTSVTGLLDELGWLPLFERHKHSHLTVFYKVLNNLSAISLDHLSVSQFHHGILEHIMKRNLCHCQFLLMFSNTHFFLGPLPTGIPSHWLFVFRSQLSPSTGLC